MNYIDLFIDIENKQLVSSRTNAVPKAASGLLGFREDQLPLRLTFLRPYAPGGLTTRFAVVDVTPLSVVVGIADPTGQDAGVALALQATWTKDETEDTFSGILDLNTTEIATRLAVEEEGKFTSQFSIKITENARTRTVLQLPITITTNALPQDIQEPSEVPVISDFVQTLEAALVNSNTITWTRNGNEMSGDVKIDPAGDLEATADGIRAKSTLARLTDLHDPVTIGDMSPNILPEFSDATADSITVSASSEINPAWKAFDGVVDSAGGGWVGVTPTPDPECTCAPEHEASVSLQIQFPEAQIITKYELVGPSDPERAPKRWYFEGSFDGAAWVIIEKREEQTDWEAHQVREFEAPHDDAGYIYYRWRFTHANGSAYTEVEEVRMEEECELFIIQLDGQILTLRLRIPPDSDLYCGPGGLRLKKKLFAFSEEEGGVVYRPSAPDIALEPKYATWHWSDTSVSPRITHHYNSTLGAWEPIDSGLRENGGIIVTSLTALDVENVPWYGRCLWRYPGNPPILHIWNDHTEAWMSICDICGVEDGYHGQLPSVVFTPASGDVPITVALSVPSVSAAVIHYTTDGSEPDGGSPVYSTPLEISEATTIKAIAYLENWLPSEVSSATYADIDETSWLLNINIRNAGAKVGRAATFDDQFSDVWNNLLAPLQQKPSAYNKTNLVNADGSPASASVEFSNWLTIDSLQMDYIGHADPMMQWAIHPKIVNSVPTPFQNGVLGFYFVLPQGVYDLYIYGHGVDNANNLVGYAEDDWSARAQEHTANGTGWLSTTWAEGQQYVLFEDLETVRIARPGVNHTLVPGTILFNLLFNAGNAFVSGIQLRKKKQLPKVVFTPGNGYNASESLQVQLSCPGYPTAEIRFTTNGDDPTGASTEYTTPIDVATALTIKAIARLPGHPSGIADSAVNSATYV